MKSILWTEKYRPRSLDEVVGHEEVVEKLKYLIKREGLPHLFISGPPSSGKTSLVLAMAEDLYGDFLEENLTIFNASDFFDLGKAYLEKEKKFLRFYDKKKTVISVFKEVVKKYAPIPPLNADFKIIFIDNAESLRYDAQQALRRMMERYSETCRFVFATSQPSKIILPIRSRCLNLSLKNVDKKKIERRLLKIAEREDLRFVDEGEDAMEYYLSDNLEIGIKVLQMASLKGQEIDAEAIKESFEGFKSYLDIYLDDLFKKGSRKSSIFEDPKNIKGGVERITIEGGYGGEEILEKMWKRISEMDLDEKKKAKMILCLGETDYTMRKGKYEYIHLENLFSKIFAVINL
ncbi:MAG: AAA family ATPase [Candidatus Methanolliviera hydrocarbonicum]|uniref:Replication factor C small subunit n=1 Tax=Candidatus Methanolliviera hydrocarbonicum TaxID=2491085 RepID=A0A520KWA3_9EURY|nr:MAG: AAA family ATPase [Candidatus Methanolliviera hydrocarbonicum]